jgi:hypothetical protein
MAVIGPFDAWPKTSDAFDAITVPHIGTDGHIWTSFCRFFSIGIRRRDTPAVPPIATH